MKKFRCLVCGEIINEGAEKCPVCGVGPDKWEEVVEGAEKVWATEHKIGEGLACGDAVRRLQPGRTPAGYVLPQPVATARLRRLQHGRTYLPLLQRRILYRPRT